MIRPLRVRHRVMMTALAVGLPVLFALGLAVRRPPPLAPAPPVLRPRPAVEPTGARDLGALWPGLSIAAALGADPADPARRVLRLVPDEPPSAPDLLVYWAAGSASETLPPGAVLLGPLAGSEPASYGLPEGAGAGAGTVLLYSLGWGRVVAAAPLAADAGVSGDDQTPDSWDVGAELASALELPATPVRVAAPVPGGGQAR